MATLPPGLTDGRTRRVGRRTALRGAGVGLAGLAGTDNTQGEPQTASNWFPCHDFPNEKLTTRVIVTVPSSSWAAAGPA